MRSKKLIKMKINPKNIVALLAIAFKDYEETETTDEEREIGVELEILIGEIVNQVFEGIPWNETSIHLEYDENCDDDLAACNNQNEEENVNQDQISLEYKRKAVEYWMNNGNKKRKLASVQHSYRSVTR